MDEAKLKTFITVSKEGSFTKAADMLYLSPVAIKNQIDALEDEVAEKLFIRKATGCTLTAAGEVFLKHACKILKAIENAKSDVEKISIALKGEIVAGHSINFNYKFMGSLSTGFSQVEEGHIIQFQKYPEEDLIELLTKREINCVFAEKTLLDQPEKYGIDFYPLASLPVFAIIKKGHLLSDRTSVSISDLAGQELYVSSILGEKMIRTFEEISDNFHIIEKTDRNILFNRIIKNAVEVYPKRFSYYECIPLNLEPVVIGIYTLKTQPEILGNMVQYVKKHVDTYTEDSDEII